MLSILNFIQIWSNNENNNNNKDNNNNNNLYYTVDGFSMLNNFVRKPSLNLQFSSSSSKINFKIQTPKDSTKQTGFSAPSSIESNQFDSISLLRHDLQTTQSFKQRLPGSSSIRSHRTRINKKSLFSLYTGEDEFNMFKEKSMMNLLFSKDVKV